MKFPFEKYEEIPVSRRNTLQIFITNVCDMCCTGCFARRVMAEGLKRNQQFISYEEYYTAVDIFREKGGKQINILGGEPLLHPQLHELLNYNKVSGIKTTVYTNGSLLNKYNTQDFGGAKLRVSIYKLKGGTKAAYNVPETDIKFEANFMINAETTLAGMLETAEYVEKIRRCKVFFIYDIRELDNFKKEFFYTTENMVDVMRYKELVHKFLWGYNGKMDIHITKRGVFESTVVHNVDTRCHFANYFIGGQIIQCPFDIINLKYQKDYEFEKRYCQQNSSCLMNKIILRPKNNWKE